MRNIRYICHGRHGDLDFRDCCDRAGHRARVVAENAMLSNARMGGRDFDPRLEVVGSREGSA